MLKDGEEEANDAFAISQNKKGCQDFMALSLRSSEHQVEDSLCAAVERENWEY